MSIDRSNGNIHGGGGFLDRQASEVAKLDDFGSLGLIGGKLVECIIDRQHDIVGVVGDKKLGVEIDAIASATMAPSLFSSRPLDEHPTHRLGRRRKEVPAAVPVLRLFDIDQPQIRIMHKRRSLKRLPGLLVG